MTIRIRSVRSQDFDAVSRLLAELGRPAVTATSVDACRRVFEAQLADAGSDHLLAVGEDDGALGFCSLHFRARLNQPTPQAWIPDLIVTESARARGIGRELLAETRRRAQERGCHELTLESGHERLRAHQVYAAAGLRETGKALLIKL